MSAESQVKKPKKFLLIGPAWVGDMIMAQTLFILLKNKDPDAIIDVVAPAWTKPLLDRMPEIRRAWLLPIKHGELRLKLRYKFGHALREEAYDHAIVMTNSFKSALIPYFAKIPIRTGWIGEYRRILLNDIRYLRPGEMPLMVQRFAGLGLSPDAPVMNPVPLPKLVINPMHREETIEKFNIEIDDRPIVALCPGAEYGPAKRWPEEYFAEVAKKKLAEGCQVWIFGSDKETPFAKVIQQQAGLGCIDFTGKTTLAEVIDLLSLVSVTVTNDSGLMHVAAALERPIVVMYGSSTPRFTPPLAKRVKILDLNLSCSPCFERKCPLKHMRCLRDMHPEMVLSAMHEVVA